MNNKYVKLACDKIKDRNVLVNVAARRAKELARGGNPMVPVDRTTGVNYLDVALREIAEDKLTFEADEEAEPPEL